MNLNLRIRIVLALLIAAVLNVQGQPGKSTTPHVCRTDEVMHEHYKAHPESKKEAEEFSKFTKSFKASDFKAASYTIPVVFHVFGTSFNGQTVTDALIKDAIKRTNEDFQGLTADWNQVISQFVNVKQAINVTFALAQIDPNGNPTTGITYHPTMNGFGNGSGYDTQIQQYAWDNYKYFNVYIQNDLYNDGVTNNSGVCWYPDSWMSDNNLARCVYNGAYIGNNTDENFRSVMTHEFGHYLNLIHPFEGGCPDASGCSTSGDQICDTPPEDNSMMEGATNCQGQVTNWQNFMTYTSNYAMFTIDQVTRMQAALQHSTRYPLWQASNLAATGVGQNLGPRLLLSTSIFEEAYQNNGSVSTTATLTAVDGAYFAATGNLTQGTHFNVSNVPSGLTVKITVNNSTSATVTLTGAANSHANTNDISNMSITFLNAAIQGGTSGLYSASLNNISINFIDPYKVVYENIADVTANSTTTWVYFTIQNGDDFGIWLDGSKLRIETYTKPLVCQSSTRNISLINLNTSINSTSNWVAGGAYPDEHDLYSSSYTTWAGKTAYIGFQTTSMGHPCYGWFKAVVASNGASFTITEYAYNETPYGSIKAGSTTLDTDTDLIPPTAPTNLSKGSATTTNIVLNWTASTDNVGVTGYDVYQGGTLKGSSTSNSFTATNLTCNTSYSFYVKAKDAAGNVSTNSSSLTASTNTCGDVQAPTAPVVSLGAVNASSVALSWTASTDNTGVTGYNVFQGSTQIGTTTTSRTFTATGLSCNTPYSFNVKARDAASNMSANSNTVTATTSACINDYCQSSSNSSSYEYIKTVTVGNFTNTSAAATYTDFTAKVINITKNVSTSISLTPGFSSSAYNEYFRMWIDLNIDGDFSDAGELVFDGSASSTTVTGNITIPSSAINGVTRMRVSMKYNGTAGACDPSTSFAYGEVEDYTVNIQGSDTQAPTTPTGLTSTAKTETSVSLSWNASTDNVGVTGYDVFVGGVFSKTATSTSTTITGLTKATTYSFTVKAKDAANNISAASTAISVTTNGTVVDPTYCTAQSNSSAYEYISKVQFGSINQTSSSSGYSNYTNVSTNLSKGVATSLSITTAGNYSSDQLVVFIDFNRNGLFTDSGEEVYFTSSAGTAKTYTASVAAPSNAVAGNVRMRVILFDVTYNSKSSCGNFSYGEVEDYTINISSGAQGQVANAHTLSNLNMTVYPNPSKDFININFSGVEGETAVVSINSLTGSTIINKTINLNENIRLDISGLASGIYLVNAIANNGTASKQIVIQ